VLIDRRELADLVILEANPLSNISNTQKINAVMVNGKYLSKADIMNMLDAQRKK
jgi:imidazolonepropionase-like amidohydrolase